MNRETRDTERLKRSHEAYKGALLVVSDRDELRFFQRLVASIEVLPKSAKYAIAAALIVAIGLIDWLSGPELSLSILYVVPVAMLGWYCGPRVAMITATICGIVWLFAEILSGKVYSNPAIAYWNALVRTGLFLIIGQTLSQLRFAVEQEQRAARTDSLTGIANNLAFVEACTYEIARQRRYGSPLSAAFLDLDNFKEINDRFGHQAGDDVLRRIAGAARSVLRDTDTIARMGGDEFALLFPETDADAARTVSDKLRVAIHASAEQYAVSFSMGVVTFGEAPAEADDLVRAADSAMYDAKVKGKNTSIHRVAG